MANVSVEKTIAAPAAQVWAYVSAWGDTHKWIPGVGPVTVVGEGPGATRSADLDPATGFPGRITEHLDAFDPTTMQFQYRVIGDSPIPIADYVASMKVDDLGDGTCTVTWTSSWVPNGDLSEDELIAAFEGLYTLSLENVAAAVA
jgi:carbon monoxide dehydrogenase subunit G